jgi:salicylate hydroxylase
LHEAALEAGCKLRPGQKVVSIKEDLSGVQLQDGTTVHGDIVVIADGKYACHSFSNIITTKLTIPGIKSALRQLINPEEDTSALSQPLSTYRAWVPMDALNTNEQVAKLLSQPATNVWLGPGRHMIVYPAEGENILAINGTYPSRNDRAGEWNKTASVDEIQQRFHDFDPVAKAILSQARDCKSWAPAEVPRLPRWRSKSGKVVLIGDAAHGMLQFLAQGAAMATEDAGALTECIKDLRSGGESPRGTTMNGAGSGEVRECSHRHAAMASSYTCPMARSKSTGTENSLATHCLPIKMLTAVRCWIQSLHRGCMGMTRSNIPVTFREKLERGNVVVQQTTNAKEWLTP